MSIRFRTTILVPLTQHCRVSTTGKDELQKRRVQSQIAASILQKSYLVHQVDNVSCGLERTLWTRRLVVRLHLNVRPWGVEIVVTLELDTTLLAVAKQGV